MLKVVKINSDNNCALLEELRQYAAVTDRSRDVMLSNILTAALLKIQEVANISLLPCTLKVTRSECDSVQLYQTVSQVTSVEADGSEVPYKLANGQITLMRSYDSVTVTYETEPNAADVIALKPFVMRYATAVYDGEDSAALTMILKEVQGLC